MFNIPTPVIKFGHKAGNWLIKNGPTIMSVSGGMMAVGGAVMACNATLRADEVLEAHKERMAQIEAARALSLEGDNDDPACVYTEKQMKHDKFIVYAETAIGFAKLYGPAFAVGMSGVGLMQAAFMVTEKRRSTAVAALASMTNIYENYKARVEEEYGPEAEAMLHDIRTEKKMVKLPGAEEETEEDVVVLDDVNDDSFFYIFDQTNPNWSGNVTCLLNERFLTSTIDQFNYRLSAHTIDHVWVNDLLKAWDMEEKDLGHFHGWNGRTGDIIEYEIVPFKVVNSGDDDEQFPMLVETTMEELREMELQDIQEGYAIGIRLLSSSDGNDDLVSPRNIYHEVYDE